MNRKLILGLVAMLVLVGGYIAYSQYSRKTTRASERDADVSIEASELLKAFVADEAGAGKLYNDKVVEVKGAVREVSGGGGGPVNVYLETGDPMGAVVCEFEAAAAPQWTAGTQVRIKGFCAGYNGLGGMGDVLLQRCAAVE